MNAKIALAGFVLFVALLASSCQNKERVETAMVNGAQSGLDSFKTNTGTSTATSTSTTP